MSRIVGVGSCVGMVLLLAGCPDDPTPINLSGGDEGGLAPTTGEMFETTIDPSLETTGDPSVDSSGDDPTVADSGGPTADATGAGSTETGTDDSGTSSTGASNVCGDDQVGGDEACDGLDLFGEDCVSRGFDDGVLGCAADCSDFDTQACVSFACGDGVVQGAEACDGADLGGADCLTLGYDAGTLSCTARCALDESGCVAFSCGNDVVEGTEVCDGAALAGQDCLSLGYDAGTLACLANCTGLDQSGCVLFSCGNGVLEGTEVCDGTQLAGQTCVSQGFDAGTLACAATCAAYDLSGCVTFSCGNGLREGVEVCDGSDLDGETCLSQGFDAGTLGCQAGCGAFDTSQCVQYVCGNGTIEGPEVCDGAAVGGLSCGTFGFPGGTLGCAASCASYDTSGCLTQACGNDVSEGTEVCDGADLAGQTCFSQGFDSGTLSCAPGCGGFDTSACVTDTCEEESIGTATGPGVSTGSTTGGDDDLPISCGGGGGIDHVVQFTAPQTGDFIIDTLGSGYDTALAVFDSCDAGSELACNDDVGESLQSRLVVSLTVGQTILIVVDGYLGTTGAFTLNIAPAGCEEQDLGSAVGAAVSVGTTVGEDDDLTITCADGGGPDRLLSFTPPFTGAYTLDTFGSDYDTGLAVFAACDSLSEFACNDDSGGLQSSLTLGLTAGVPVIVAVEGYAGASGNWVLNIAPLACVDGDVGSALGAPVATGDTTGASDELPLSCAGGGGADVIAIFTAPATATYVFDTLNSGYDTALALFDSCAPGTELACNDDTVGVTSQVSLAMTAGQSVLVVIDGFNGAQGLWNLNIAQQ